MSARSWVVLGASSSIARAFARLAAARGFDLVLAGRDLEDLDRSAADLRVRHRVEARALPFDALDHQGHAAFAARCRELVPGELNLLLAFAVMHDQAAIGDDVGKAFATLLGSQLGAVSVLHHFTPLFARQGRGRIVVIGSIAGDRGRPKNYVYGAAKAGLHAYAEGMRGRLFRAGVSVTLIKPGFVDTAMTWGRPGMFRLASPEACARAILRHALARRDVAYVPGFWWPIAGVLRAIPSPLFKRLGL